MILYANQVQISFILPRNKNTKYHTTTLANLKYYYYY